MPGHPLSTPLLVAVAYGVRHRLVEGAFTAAGRRWRIRPGETTTVHWRFHQGWDGARGAPFYYQAHSSGRGSGMGDQTRWGGAATVLMQ
ncbi:MAG: hypothetical protein GWM92_10235 [Gemmatimonadetes bacterium]|nr:hypothetical protein [Gemmatimonadota bacterium]NIR79042.1 hypothetical protein [Gemmatimonadota bacterium]NIT87699.1 hypothetical protein [Gemmatimonadota bacterium]NIU31560.1 hypothetical protein [Gemmatimonadota bacterium]NIU36216.1 hypothetical protein [Gemmatimonadota bacterium]